MAADGYHNRTREGRPATLAQLHAFVKGADLPAQRRSEICSAIKRAAELTGREGFNMPADPALVMRLVGALSPAMAGMTSGAFANLKSRLRAAFRLARPRPVNVRGKRVLSAPWQALLDKLGEREARSMSRLFGFASHEGWQPSEFSDAHMERFVAHLRDEALVVDWEKVVRRSTRGWNRLAAVLDIGQARCLSPVVPRRTPYWVSEDALQPQLRQDLHAFLDHLREPSIFAGLSTRKLKPATVEQYRTGLITLISAMVASGTSVESLCSLAQVVSPAGVERALRYLHDRRGKRVTMQMKLLVHRAKIVARWCEAPEAAILGLDTIQRSLDAHYKPSRTLTTKNRTLLDRLDDERFRDLIHALPTILFRMAETAKPSRAPSIARVAMAIELLLVCSMRRENLVTLELGRSIRKVGQAPNAHWIIEIAPEAVKNEEPLRYQLPTDTARRLETYLRVWRPAPADDRGSWFFPGQDGTSIDPRTMAHAIATLARRVTGVAITPHQFRHISAELYLREVPDGLLTVSQHLGHRDINTTRWFYSRPKQRQASRRYQERVVMERGRAEARLRIRKRPSRPAQERDLGDTL